MNTLRTAAPVLVAILLSALAPAVGSTRAAPDVGTTAAGPLSLWYDEPATDWETQSLPIGSGALGGGVFGTVAKERIQLNEKTLWTGGPGSTSGYDFGNWTSPRPGAIRDVQDRIDREHRVAPADVAAALGQPKHGFGAYQTFGELGLTLTSPPGGVTNYRRDLDIGRAVATVAYDAGGVRYTREYFASAADKVLVARLSASQPGRIGFTTTLTAPDNRSKRTTASGGRSTFAGALTDNGMKFESQLQVVGQGGSRTDNGDGSVSVSNADSAVVVLAMGTNYAADYPTYRGADPHQRVQSTVDAAVAKGWNGLLNAHEQDYRGLFDRVRLDLGQQVPAIPTDELLSGYANAAPAAKRALEVLYFQYGRYLLISSSRAGSLPANLQGVWNNSTSPPWDDDYHVNINLQMNYWPAETTNLSETAAPLFDYVDEMREPGAVTARDMFGNRGWVVNNETNPFGFTGVHQYPEAFWFPEAGSWLAQHYYEHYLFTGDQAFLRDRAYPVLKSLAQFWLDELRVDPRDGKLVVTPSYSPEHGDFSAGAAMSQQIVWNLFTNVVSSAAVLGDTAFGDEVRTALGRLDPGTRIGSWGQLQEWKEDWDSATDTHRHVSQLFGLFPGNQLTTPALTAAAKVSLAARGDGGTGWSKAWKINFWARLLDGDHAQKMLSEQLTGSTLANLWDTHPPFQIDGNFGATSGVAEMLLQSQNGVVHVLPALPSSWPTGSYAGLKARGGTSVDVRWSGGSAVEIGVTPTRNGPLTVRNGLFRQSYRLVDAGTGQVVPVTANGDSVTFTARAGHRYAATGGCGEPAADTPVVAWDPQSGDTVTDRSRNARHATVQAGGAYAAEGSTGSALVLDGTRYLRTQPTSLGRLPRATFAAEVKVTTSGGYRRLFDFQPSGDPGADGVLIDLTPTNQVRFIGAGQGVTTAAVVPTGRYVDVVVTLADGLLTVYLDGRQAATAQVGAGGVNGCATRQLRFGADQDGGQRLTGAVDRMAVLPRALGSNEVPNWRSIAFG
ncbi:glycosyl hydrolase family 95 catalytic domain-containing protein [Umezawaea sp. Da 62-37]|uniref:glycosyl hydrolase family 95 catalytic domain-containing protein n=1 Tax=Umezawaea sp. Da 62-37 TaxID=3075927 RepID=UPI0037DDDA54